MENESMGNLTGLAKIVQTILTTSGPVALLAIALAAFLMWTVQRRLDTIQGTVDQSQTELQSAKITMHAFAEKQMEINELHASQLGLLIKISRQICINNAKSEMAVNNCLAER